MSPVFQQKHYIPKVNKEQVETILVTQGGSDTHGYTPKIIRALYDIPNDINFNVIIGPNFSHYQELDEALHDAPRNFTIIKDKGDLSELMFQADLAISAAGITLFELACMGVSTIVICGELYEVETANRLQKVGFGINLGFGKYIEEKKISNTVFQLMNDINSRLTMSKKGKELIDGNGVKRMVENIVEYFYSKDNVYKKLN